MSLLATGIGLVLFLAPVWLVMRSRPRLAVTGPEGLAILAFAVLALVQGALEHQVQVDDLVFTAAFFAIPGILGTLRGPAEAYVGTSLGMIIALVVAASHPFARHLHGDGVVLPPEWIMLWVSVATAAVASGLLARRAPWLGPFGVIASLLFYLAVQPEVLLSTIPWAAIAGAVALAEGALLIVERVALAQVETR